MFTINNDSFLRLDSTEYTREHVQSLSLTRLKEMHTHIKDQVADIAYQQRVAKGDYANNGISADWDWYKKADFAKMALIKWEHEVHSLMKEKKEAAAAISTKTYERYYVEIAKDIIAPAQDQIIKDAVRDRMKDDGWET